MSLTLKLYKGKSGPSYYAVGQVNGVRVNRATGFAQEEKIQAQIKALEIEREVLLTLSGSTDKGASTSINSMLDVYLNRPGGVGVTTTNTIKLFCDTFGEHDIMDIKPADILKHYTSAKRAPATVRRDVASVQGFINFSRKALNIDQKFYVHKPPPSSPKATKFSVEQRDDLLKLCALTESWFLPHLLVYFFSGIRRSELVKLKWEDVEFDAKGNPTVMVIRSRKGVRGTVIVRRITLHTVLVPVFAKLAKTKHPDGYIFRSKEGASLQADPDRINKAFRPLADSLKLQHLTLHDMRRTFASMLLANEVSDHLITNLLGHIDTRMLKVYAIAEDRLRASAIAKIPSPTGGGSLIY